MAATGPAVRIGLLSAAHVHADRCLAILASMPGVALAGVWDSDPLRGAAAANAHSAAFVSSLEAILDRVDAVVVTSATADHRRLVEVAAAAGVHVLCEKPLATNVEDGRAMVGTCASAGIQLMPAFPMRWSPAMRALAESIGRGTIGDVLCLEGVNCGEMPDGHGAWFVDPVRAGGGALMDHVVHLVDLYRWMLGTEIVEVHAIANRVLRDHFDAVETGALVSLRFSNGAIATIDASWSRPPSYPTWGGLSIEAVGTLGVLTADAFRQHLAVHAGADPGTRWHYWGTDARELMLAEFVSAVRERRPPAITGVDGLRALEVVEAAYRSVATGGPAPVGRC